MNASQWLFPHEPLQHQGVEMKARSRTAKIGRMTLNEQARVIDGFLLGIFLSEHLNKLPPLATVHVDGFREVLQQIAGGDLTLVGTLREIQSQSPTTTDEERSAVQASTKAAAEVIDRWFTTMENEDLGG